MNGGEIFHRRGGNFNRRSGVVLKRESGEEREGEIANGVAKLRAIGAVPGVDGIEWAERAERSIFDDANEVESGVGDGARAVGEANQR